MKFRVSIREVNKRKCLFVINEQLVNEVNEKGLVSKIWPPNTTMHTAFADGGSRKLIYRGSITYL